MRLCTARQFSSETVIDRSELSRAAAAAATFRPRRLALDSVMGADCHLEAETPAAVYGSGFIQ